MECGRDHHIKYRVIPNLFDCLPGKTEIATIGSLPMIKLYEEPLRGPQRALKRGMDVASRRVDSAANVAVLDSVGDSDQTSV